MVNYLQQISENTQQVQRQQQQQQLTTIGINLIFLFYSIERKEKSNHFDNIFFHRIITTKVERCKTFQIYFR